MRGKILLCTHREGLWILTGIPGSPEGPASPSSPVLPYTSEETVNTMSSPSPTQHRMLCLLSLEESSSHLPVLPSRLWTLLVQGDPARTGIRGQGQDKGLVRFRVQVKITVWVKAGVWVRDSARVRVRAESQIQSQDH